MYQILEYSPIRNRIGDKKLSVELYTPAKIYETGFGISVPRHHVMIP